VFIMPIRLQLVGVWLSGAEPAAARYIAQRMLASKSAEGRARRRAVLQIAHTCCARGVDSGRACVRSRLPGAVRHPARVSRLDPSLLGHDIAYPAMLKFLPSASSA
jgi:hypothetical protein